MLLAAVQHFANLYLSLMKSALHVGILLAFILLLGLAMPTQAQPKHYRVVASQSMYDAFHMAVEIRINKLLGPDFALGAADFNLSVRPDDIDGHAAQLDATYKSPFSFDIRPDDYFSLSIATTTDRFVVHTSAIKASTGTGEMVTSAPKLIARVIIPITNPVGFNTLSWQTAPMEVVNWADQNYKTNGDFVVTNPLLNFTPPLALPVQLISFNGDWKDNGFQASELKWVTTAETQVDHFEVERSFDSRNFTNLTNVPAGQAKGSYVNYKLDDNNVPFNTGNIVYYRLNMTGTDGSKNYSKIVELHRPEPGNSFSLYPNPVHRGQILTLQSSRDATENMVMRIIDANGRLVYEGHNTNTTGTLMKICTDKFTTGNYTIQIENVGQRAPLRFVVQ
jgi:hypothetical protein